MREREERRSEGERGKEGVRERGKEGVREREKGGSEGERKEE